MTEPDLILTLDGARREFRTSEVTSKQCRRLRDESGLSMPRLITDVALDLDAWSFSVMWWFTGLQHDVNVPLDQVDVKGTKGQQWDLEFVLDLTPDPNAEPGDGAEPDEWAHLPEG